MENLGSDFNTTGSVMTPQELAAMRKRRGECVTCGRKCFKKKVFKMIPLTEPGEVLNGKCLRCNPIESGGLSSSGQSRSMQSGGPSLSGSMRQHGPSSSSGVAARSSSLKTVKSNSSGMTSNPSRANSLPLPRNKSTGAISVSNRSMNSTKSSGSGGGMSAASTGALRNVREEPGSFTVPAKVAPEPPAAPSSVSDSYGPDQGDDSYHDYEGYAVAAAASFGATIPTDLPPIPVSRETETACVLQGYHPSQSSNRQSDLGLIVDRLNDSTDTPEGVERSLEDMAILELSLKDLDTLAGMDAPKIIARAMCRHMDSILVQKWGCSAVMNLSATERCQRDFVRGGVLDAIVTTMEKNINDSSFQEQALMALANLGISAKNLSTMIRRDCVTKIIEAMNAHTGKSSVQIKACNAVTNLASHDSHHKRKVMEIAGGVVVIAMVMNPHHVKLLEAALRALRNLSLGNDDNKTEIANNGGVDSIISAMQVHRDEAGIQLEGAWTLANLTTTNENKEVIGDCGGIDVIVRALWVHEGDRGVIEKCLRALFNISLDAHNAGIVLEVDGIKAIVAVMQGHPDSAAIQEMGCAVLYNLGDVSDENRMKIVDDEALDAIVLSMVLHAEDAEVQKRACLVLQCLCIPDNFKPMFAANIVELVTVAGDKFPGCRKPHDFILAQMDADQVSY
eukprot:scaffold5074_cov99-Cylindrotheca_fusiformis.AAC.10